MSDDPQAEQPNTPNTIQHAVCEVHLESRQAQFNATQQFRKLLSIEQNPPISEAAGCVLCVCLVVFACRLSALQFAGHQCWGGAPLRAAAILKKQRTHNPAVRVALEVPEGDQPARLAVRSSLGRTPSSSQLSWLSRLGCRISLSLLRATGAHQHRFWQCRPDPRRCRAGGHQPALQLPARICAT